MTAEYMQYSFEMKIGTFHKVDKVFTSHDIAMFLNKAQYDFIKDRYEKRDATPMHYFEVNEKVRTELASLIKSQSYSSGDMSDSESELHSNAVFVSLPSDILYPIEERAVVSYTDCNGDTATKNAIVKPVTHDQYAYSIKSPWKKPYEGLIFRIDYGTTNSKKHELVHASSQSITSYVLRYIKKPTSINIINGTDCELHESVHEEIVDRAVFIALSTIPKDQNVEQKTET